MPLAAAAPAPGFHPLRVADVRKTTRDAVVVTFDAALPFEPGQYLTLRTTLGGQEVRRTYSICAAPGAPLAVGIKRVPGGAFSCWANDVLAPGDVIEAMAPMGRFAAPPDARRLLMVAAGSGITPILSILRATLARPDTRATLIYANRSVASIMFREEIEDLKNRHMTRLQVLHALSRGGEGGLLSGRLEAERLDALFDVVAPARYDAGLVCGPEPMTRTVVAAMRAHGLQAVSYELFGAGRPARRDAAAEGEAATAQVTLDGATYEVALAPGMTVLEAALAEGIEAPYACTAGVCSTCRALVLDGEVEMDANHALEDYEIARGYVLTCQSRCRSSRLRLTYDA